MFIWIQVILTELKKVQAVDIGNIRDEERVSMEVLRPTEPDTQDAYWGVHEQADKAMRSFFI